MHRTIGLCALLFLFACSDSQSNVSKRAEAARGVVTEFVEAGLDGQKDRQIEMLAAVDRVKARDPAWTPMIFPSENLEYLVGAAIVDGDRASVRLSLLEAGVTESFDVLLIDESGSWRILEGETIDRLAERIAGELSRQFDGLLDSAGLPDEPPSEESSSGEPSSGEPSSGEPSSGEPSSGEPSSGEPSSGEPAESSRPGEGETRDAPDSEGSDSGDN